MKTDAQYADPFTGGSRYIPQSTTNTASHEFTRSTASNSSDASVPSYIPHTKYLKLEQANLSQILGIHISYIAFISIAFITVELINELFKIFFYRKNKRIKY